MIAFFMFLLKKNSQTVLLKWWLFLVRTGHIPHEIHYQPNLCISIFDFYMEHYFTWLIVLHSFLVNEIRYGYIK